MIGLVRATGAALLVLAVLLAVAGAASLFSPPCDTDTLTMPSGATYVERRC